jgi:hypothetical protein
MRKHSAGAAMEGVPYPQLKGLQTRERALYKTRGVDASRCESDPAPQTQHTLVSRGI